MYIILLSGGSGKRLWPLSNTVRSKQFIKFFKNENGEPESMIQRIYRQIKSVDSSIELVVAAPKNQASTIINQLGDNVKISIEPERRDTFPAILLAVSYIHDVVKIDENEPVIICPIDSNVNEDFFKSVIQLDELVKKTDSNICLLGINPSYPSEKYGYIIPQDNKDVSAVSYFKEKPSLEEAKELLSKGALWNGGVFAFKMNYLLEKAHKICNFIDYADLYQNYSNLEQTSFDYAVLEKESKLSVLKYYGEWRDVGTWNTLTESLDEDVVGKGMIGDNCKNVNIINELDIPVLVMGLTDVVISASPDGILISDKNESSYIKKYVDSFEEMERYKEKSWGSFKIINVENESLTIRVELNAGHRMNYHSHERRDEVWIVVSGKGKTIIDGNEKIVEKGDVIEMECGCKHTIEAVTDLILIEVQIGDSISIEDKRKYF